MSMLEKSFMFGFKFPYFLMESRQLLEIYTNHADRIF